MKPRFKNRTLIRARSLILPPAVNTGSLSQTPAAAAASRATLARRFSFQSARSASGRKPGTPTNFVPSGKHGMAIRRVNISDLASRRASVGKTSPRAATPAAGAGGAKRKRASPPSTPSVMTALAAAKAALLSKYCVRSVASRKAAAVVAGARAKRARVLVRNMTLYRGKGEGGLVAGSAGAGGNERGGEKGKVEAAAKRKKKARVKTEPCLFFCKFGKCSKSDEECRFVHDKAKVAVCRAFLKGRCEKGDKCLLTHAVQAEKMPVCVFFEKGMCFTPNCPYLHVKVSRNAAVCPNFLKVSDPPLFLSFFFLSEYVRLRPIHAGFIAELCSVL